MIRVIHILQFLFLRLLQLLKYITFMLCLCCCLSNCRRNTNYYFQLLSVIMSFSHQISAFYFLTLLVVTSLIEDCYWFDSHCLFCSFSFAGCRRLFVYLPFAAPSLVSKRSLLMLTVLQYDVCYVCCMWFIQLYDIICVRSALKL